MYSLVVFGISYHSADVILRDKFAANEIQIKEILQRLKATGVAKEAVFLSTCNRVEVYAIAKDYNLVVNAICDYKNICPREIKQTGYVYHEIECVRHLYRVVSGLDSMILGESEIVAQVKQAMDYAIDAGSMGSYLSKLFQMALSVEKDVRNETLITHSSVSMGSATVKLLDRYLWSINKGKILFLGAGKIMQQIAPYFKDIELGEKIVLSRKIENAKELADKIHATSADLTSLEDVFEQSAIVIACISSDDVLITRDMLARTQTNKVIIDLSMPQITAPEARELLKIKYFCIDDIAKIVNIGKEQRELAADIADKILEEKLVEFAQWEQKRELTPLIKKLRDDAEEIRSELYAAAIKNLDKMNTKDVILQLSLQLTNKLLHKPTVNMYKVEEHNIDNMARLVSYLYDIEA